MTKLIRPEMTNAQIAEVIKKVQDKILIRLEQKGRGIMSSKHEVFGILAEEFNKELLDSIHENAPIAEVVNELLDIAVGCIIGIVSVEIIGEHQ